ALATNFVDYALKTAKVKRVAILADTSAYYKELAETTVSTAKAAGLAITGVESFEARAPDVVPQLLATRRGNPDMVFLVNLFPVDVVTTMRGMRELGFNVPLVLGLAGGAQAGAIPG